ncbi:MAG: DNA primase [Chloroflexi bacterium]|nr:DNA primase [Chloroflexota bacterium]
MSVVDDVKQKIDIVDVIAQYATLKKAGRNYKALCPFHNEKTPSFVVFPDQGTWHCFGACNTGGDVFAFLMRRENIDFGEALRRLALKAGVPLIRQAPGEEDERKQLREIMGVAAGHFHYLLKNHPEAQAARDYLANRHISSAALEMFELGYSLNQWEACKSFLVGRGYSVHDLEAAGLVVKSEREQGGYYDRFRGRLMFPIRNRNGEVIGFGARTLSGEEPKYLNSPQTALFDKSGTLYGLDLAKDAIRTQNLAVIVEGYMDVIGAHQAEFHNVVASLGTALTEKQLALLKRLTKRYALALDSDAAGEEATKRGLQIAREALDRKTVPVPMGAGLVGFEERLEAELLVIPLPQGQDPDELIHANPAQWSDLVAHAEPLVDFYFRVLTQDLDLSTPKDKSLAVKRLTPIIVEIGDVIQRAHYTQQLARLVHVPEQTIVQELGGHRPRLKTDESSSGEISSGVTSPGLRLEEYCLGLLLYSPKLMGRIPFLEPEAFGKTEHRMLFGALAEWAEGEGVDREAFVSALDESLQPLCDRLEHGASVGRVGDLSDGELSREVETVAYRLFRQRDKDELAQIETQLREEDTERTAEEEMVLRQRAEFLRRRISNSDKALSARTLLKPRPLYLKASID